MNKYLIKDIDVDINLECDDDIYYPTEVIKDTYIDADSPKQAFLEFVKKLEDDCDGYGLYDARYDLVWPIADFDTLEDIGYYDIKRETLNSFLWPLVVPNSETIGYTIDASCTWVDADCYTHDDGPVELTFAVTEVYNMIPEEFQKEEICLKR